MNRRNFFKIITGFVGILFTTKGKTARIPPKKQSLAEYMKSTKFVPLFFEDEYDLFTGEKL